jgi:phosphoglycolate phosphatase
LAQFGIAKTLASEAALRHGVSGGARALLKVLCGHDVGDEVVTAMLNNYASAPVRLSRLFAGAEAWFAMAPVAVVTNKSRRFAAEVVRQLCPAGTVLVCPEDAGAAKPDPAPIRLGLKLLGVQAGEAIYVGDDLRDEQAAVAAGVPFIAALYGYGGDFSASLVAASRAIRSPAELAQHLGVP